MIWILAFVLVLIVVVGPSQWVKWVLKRYSAERADFPGTGGDMARHLITRLELGGVQVEETEGGDHYDPSSKTVRLTKDKLDGRSLTAVVVAAHEVGHALQDHLGEASFKLRSGLAVFSYIFQKIAPAALIAAPLLAVWNPAISRWAFMAAIGSMLVSTLVSLVTLPVEWNASFGKALPILQSGEYLSDDDMQGARRILFAAAMTYVAGSLISLLSVGAWLRMLRR
ncbi:MAG: zinc metallopeptidase [Thalassolituus oleivorans]|uniref:zinc metallopeptidase n=1 Tax=Thalassolituus oleivorans TaxID=187493 RepID=UPI001B63DBE2|nr:zinc metallopeptidase [Thalassolituus oleivorans]MBQ0726603.1 zinc metallopeptidase [Thalassolituus oleivorans]